MYTTRTDLNFLYSSPKLYKMESFEDNFEEFVDLLRIYPEKS